MEITSMVAMYRNPYQKEREKPLFFLCNSLKFGGNHRIHYSIVIEVLLCLDFGEMSLSLV